ncbi:MAG: hypothetical protein AB1Z98_23515 [Nannocystaceae bacterium]
MTSTRGHGVRTLVCGLLLATSPVAGCGCENSPLGLGGIGSGGDGDGGDGGGAERQPYRDQWRIEAEVAFDHTGPDGEVLIGQLGIGGPLTNDNFANRGDVIVKFDGAPGRILVEMRRFTHTTSLDNAMRDFDDLSLWAFAAPLGRPQDLDAEDDCTQGAWQDGCEVRVYYDGLSQLSRSGADLRVTLPADYRYQLDVQTQDDVADDDYFNRGDVCIDGLFASASVTADSGNVWVRLSPSSTPTPTCSDSQIAACEGWTSDDGQAAPWDPACGCTSHGALDVATREANASNITVDLPSALWASIRAESSGDGQQIDGQHCEARLELPSLEYDVIGNDFPWQASAASSYPGEPAIGGAGYFVSLESRACGPVAHTDDPEDFVGAGLGDLQESELRGNLRVCDGCITQGCNDLIP